LGKRFVLIILAVALIFSLAVVMGNFKKEIRNEAAETTRLYTSKTQKEKEEISKYTALNYTTVKAMWLSQFDMSEVYIKGDRQRPVNDYTEKAAKIIENISSLGINTVFFQLRPNGDSLYPSKLFPASKYAAGVYGRELDYDPFEIFLDLAHEANLSVHA